GQDQLRAGGVARRQNPGRRASRGPTRRNRDARLAIAGRAFLFQARNPGYRPMAGKNSKGGKRAAPAEIRNSKVHRDYHVEDTFEAGIMLTGTEVKSVRAGKAQLSEGFCRFNKGEFYIYGLHIDEYAFGNINNHIPRRERKLLLKRAELRKIAKALEADGKAAIPTRMYFKDSLIKVEVAICVGKKLFDKREDLKKKAVMR